MKEILYSLMQLVNSIFFDATCEHAMVALNDEKAKFLAVIM